MSIVRRIDPELVSVIASLPELDLSDMAAARQQQNDLISSFTFEASPHVVIQDLRIPRRAETPEVELRIFTPSVLPDKKRPAICWIQGGGYVLGGAIYDNSLCQDLALTHDCVVAAVRWRRAPEHPFPAALEDCYSALAWLASDPEGLWVDTQRLVVAGASSGGGTAAGTALLVRDRAEFALAHQLLIYPMLDDRNDSASARLVTDSKVWNSTSNAIAWRAYLGDAFSTDKASPYAAPARMSDLAGSSDASILTGELDLFRDENILYAMRLMAAEVPTELHVYPAAPHGFDQLCPTAGVSRRFIADRDAILSRVFNQPLT